jgi:DNA-binding response OmpR family regulator
MVLDLGLPGRDGFTVLRLLREARVRTPVIILTARDTVGDTVAGLEGGADDYIRNRSVSRNCSPGCGCGSVVATARRR